MDPTSQITNFINQSRAAGKSDVEIKQTLLQSGWQEAQIIPHFLIPSPTPTTAPITQPSPLTTTAFNPASNPPWSSTSLLVVSVLFGPVASYLTVWQTLKKIQKTEIAEKFLKLGWLAPLAITILAVILPADIAKSFGNASGILLPLWLDIQYFKKWRAENPGVAKFQWSIFGWGLLGFFIYINSFIFSFIIAGPSPK